MEVSNNSLPVPEYINFLLDPSTPLDFNVKVKNPDGSPSESIKAVKWMLIARSKVMRVMLLESELKHDKEFSLPDIDSVTFTHFLVFLYGHDQISLLSLEEALKLLYASEKYDVQDMKERLGSVIKPQVNVDNIFSVLCHAPVCEKVPDLWKKITEIIQYNTHEIFSSEQFTRVSPEVLLHIVQQDQLSVPEIDVWRAALFWAMHQDAVTAAVVSPYNLRRTILPFLKHIRLCTLTTDQLCQEVLPTQVLTTSEIAQICTPTSVRIQKTLDKLTYLSNETGKRKQVSLILKTPVVTQSDALQYTRDRTNTLVYFLVKEKPVALYGVDCLGNKAIESVMSPKTEQYRCQCKIQIMHMPFGQTSTEPNIVIEVNQMVMHDKSFLLPLKHNNRPVVLNANNKYQISLSFYSEHKCFNLNEQYYKGDLFNIEFSFSSDRYYSSMQYECHFKTLHCKVLHNT